MKLPSFPGREYVPQAPQAPLLKRKYADRATQEQLDTISEHCIHRWGKHYSLDDTDELRCKRCGTYGSADQVTAYNVMRRLWRKGRT